MGCFVLLCRREFGSLSTLVPSEVPSELLVSAPLLSTSVPFLSAATVFSVLSFLSVTSLFPVARRHGLVL